VNPRSGVALRAIALVAVLAAGAGCRQPAAGAEAQKAEIASLEAERDRLRQRLDELVPRDKRLEGMPGTPLRVGVPTSLTRELVERMTAGFVDQVTLVLQNLHVHKAGSVKKVVTLGDYDLDVTIERVSGRLRTGRPEIAFGGNRISVALPVEVASGSGHATIRFKWDGKGVSDAVCGDMEITREVSGGVKPDRYPMRGSLLLSASAERILVAPRFPPLEVNLKVEPSPESWAAVQAVIDEKEGVCGFVLDKVDILGVVRRLVEKGFNVRLPTEKLKPVAVPVGVEPSMTIRGKPVTLGVKVGGLAITEGMIWLGADVQVTPAVE
jgi:hypothetical protein